jgi:hypothetical protein
MPIRWSQHLQDDEEREKFKQTVKASQTALRRLVELLFQDLNSMTATEYTLDDFEDPAWGHKQAFRNGYKKAMVDYITLIEGALNSDH